MRTTVKRRGAAAVVEPGLLDEAGDALDETGWVAIGGLSGAGRGRVREPDLKRS